MDTGSAAEAQHVQSQAGKQETQPGNIFRWEQNDGRSWEDLEEDASGQLHDAQAAAHYKRQRLEYASRSAKRRMVRYLVLIVDLSSGLDPNHNRDLRPNPFTVRFFIRPTQPPTPSKLRFLPYMRLAVTAPLCAVPL